MPKRRLHYSMAFTRDMCAPISRGWNDPTKGFRSSTINFNSEYLSGHRGLVLSTRITLGSRVSTEFWKQEIVKVELKTTWETLGPVLRPIFCMHRKLTLRPCRWALCFPDLSRIQLLQDDQSLAGNAWSASSMVWIAAASKGHAMVERAEIPWWQINSGECCFMFFHYFCWFSSLSPAVASVLKTIYLGKFQQPGSKNQFSGYQVAISGYCIYSSSTFLRCLPVTRCRKSWLLTFGSLAVGSASWRDSMLISFYVIFIWSLVVTGGDVILWPNSRSMFIVTRFHLPIPWCYSAVL